MRVMRSRDLGLAALAAGLARRFGRGARRLRREGQGRLHASTAAGSATAPSGRAASPARKLAPDPMPLEAFTAFVRTTNRAMPPYREAVLSNEDLADIYAYLQSIPKPADYKTIPLLNQ